MGEQLRARAATGPARQRFTAALDALVVELKQDRSVLAAILCGSLSHDVVWSRSDIDLVLVTADDKPGDRTSVTLDASGVHVHAFLFTRGQFRQSVEGSLHNSFIHSFVAKGRLLFTHDPTIADLHERLRAIGDRDTRVQLLEAAANAVSCMHKARKWLVTRGDLEYTALWILHAATPIARIEVVGRKLVADREVIPQAAALNPEVFRVIYMQLLNTAKSEVNVQAALQLVERYVRERAKQLFAPVFEYLNEATEARSCTEINHHFRRHYGIEDVTTACEYLAEEGLIGKAAVPVRLTRKSTVAVQELAFVSSGR